MINKQPLRVGLVGASVSDPQSWAMLSHIPALQALNDFVINATCTTRISSAKAAAEVLGAQEYYDNCDELAASPNVDVVVVSVNVPDHFKPVMAALRNSKHVMCEWPLARNVDEAKQIVVAARDVPRARTLIGLQTRMNPTIRYVRELLQSKRIGEIQTTTVVAPAKAFSKILPSRFASMIPKESGANLVSIIGGHTLDATIFLLGDIAQLSALGSIVYKKIQLVESGEMVDRVTPDHLMMHARTTSGVPFFVEVSGNRPDRAFEISIYGSEGHLTITSNHWYGFQAGDFELTASIPLEDKPVVDESTNVPRLNVQAAYKQFGEDIHNNTSHSVDFEHAGKLSNLIESVFTSIETGETQHASATHPWPSQ